MKRDRQSAWRALSGLSTYHRQVAELIQRHAEDLHGGGAVLDVGCGMMPFWAVFGKRVRYWGVDQAAVQDLPAPLVIGVMERLPFREDTFSAALSTFSLHQVNTPAMALREMARVLRSGGRLFLAVPSRAYLAYRLPVWMHPPEFKVQKAFARAELVRLVEQSGFAVSAVHVCGGLLAQLYENARNLAGRLRAPSRSQCHCGAAGHVRTGNTSWLSRCLATAVCAVELLGGWRHICGGIWVVVAQRDGDR